MSFKTRVKKIIFNKFTYKILKLFISKKQEKIDEINLDDFYVDVNFSSLTNRKLSENLKDLSIIIPCYNCSKYIGECINSILNQNISQYDYEILLINDGSTDDTLKIIEELELQNKNIKVFTKENGGAASARNYGIDRALGKYILFIDADDILFPNVLGEMLTIMINEQLDVLQGRNLYFYKDDINNNKECKTSYQLNGYPCGKMYRKELFEDNQFPNKYWYEDTNQVFISFKKAKKIKVINDYVFYYRQHKSNTSRQSNKNPRRIETFYVTRRLYKDYLQLFKVQDKYLLEQFLKQLWINYYRTMFLKKDVKKTIFYLSCQIYREISNSCETEILKELQEILMKSNYRLYEIYMLCH